MEETKEEDNAMPSLDDVYQALMDDARVEFLKDEEWIIKGDDEGDIRKTCFDYGFISGLKAANKVFLEVYVRSLCKT